MIFHRARIKCKTEKIVIRNIEIAAVKTTNFLILIIDENLNGKIIYSTVIKFQNLLELSIKQGHICTKPLLETCLSLLCTHIIYIVWRYGEMLVIHIWNQILRSKRDVHKCIGTITFSCYFEQTE